MFAYAGPNQNAGNRRYAPEDSIAHVSAIHYKCDMTLYRIHWQTGLAEMILHSVPTSGPAALPD